MLSIIGVFVFTNSEKDNQVSINGNPLDIQGEVGVTKSNDDYLVKKTTEEDLKMIYDSIDPITGQPTYLPPVLVKVSDEDDQFQQAETCKLTCVIDEKTSYDFTFKYVIKDDKKILITKGEVFSSCKIPKSDNYAIYCGGLIYLLDLNEGKLEMFNSKDVEGYSFYTFNDTNYRKVWASKPSFNPNGTKMLYYTERCTKEVGRLWVMDYVTNTEKPIPNTDSYNKVLQWVSDDVVYIRKPYEVIRVDISNYTAETVYSDNNNAIGKVVLTYPYMFVSDINGSRIHNLEDGSIRIYDDSRYTSCANAVFGIEYKALLVFYMHKENIDTYHEAVVLDLETGKESVISVSEKDIISLFLPYNDEKAKLDVQINGEMYDILTYFIDYNSLTFN